MDHFKRLNFFSMKYMNSLIIAVICLVVGFVIGWLVFGSKSHNMAGMHQMPNGEMMTNNGMSMHDMMGSMMSGLSGKTGDEFDKAFLEEMIIHHEGAVEMARAVLATSKRPELLKLANDIIAAQTNEIGMMKKWKAEWFR